MGRVKTNITLSHILTFPFNSGELYGEDLTFYTGDKT